MYKNKENNFTGLTEEEVRRSREEHGSNKLPDPELKKWWEFALDALKEPITVILIVITIVTLILSILGVEHISGPILTLIVIGLVTGIAVKTNTAIQKSTENLRRKTAIRYCEVIRDGEVKTINADDLVVGDITMVTLGQEIHADGYLIDGKISVSNAVINGEAEECKKTVIQDYVYEKDESTDAYKNQNHLFAGTVVVAGEGLEKVTVVGKDTVNGETLINMQTLEAPKTALDIALGKLANFINKWGTIAAIIAFVTMTVSGIMQAGLAQYFSGNVLEIINKIAANVSNAATIIVAAVPEGLPLIVKLVTKQNVNIMEKFNILAKNPNKIPELAYVNLICTDKTGTLTTGVMSPEVIVDGEGNEVRDNSDLAKTLYESIVLNNSSFYNEEHKIIGNNFIDRAILSLVVPKEYEMINEKYSIERKQAFSSELKYSVAYCSNGYSYYKGAPEIIIDNCTKYMTADGSVKDWDSSATLAKLSELTQNANRCIAIAVKSGDYEDDTLAQGMTFLGIIGVSDPIRPEAIEAVKVAHKAGIQVIELTGDCMETALAVAKQCGIFREGKDVALTDNEIREMSDDEVKKVLSKLMVVSRCSPNTKLRLVTLPLMVDFFNSGAAQVIMMLAKSGAGKTFSAFQIALSLIALDIHVSAIDIKGREWRKLLKFVDGVEINMDDENPRFVNTMRLDDFGCTRENCEYYFRMAVRATVNLLSIMVNLKPEEGNVTDLETILEQAVLKYFSQNNVDSKNPKTFVNTRRMKYADIIDIISDLATTKSYSEDQRELCSVIRTRCSTYFVTEGRYSKAFKNEITVAEVLRKPLVIYSFNKNADVMLDTMDTLRVFMVQYLDTKKQSIRKEQKLHTAAFYEELQRSNQFGKLVETISHAVTGSRSNNVMIFLLLNAVSVFNNNELNAIKSNITTKIVGKLEDGDIDLLVKEYGCKPIQKQLEKINDKSTNRWQNCFAILYDTGVDVDKAIYRTVVPQYMLEQFKTRDFNENIK